jgi:hypothetical protein
MPSPKIPDKTADAYYQKRMESLAKRLVDFTESLFNKESITERQEFEEHVERRLQNGAKFIPRKRQPR